MALTDENGIGATMLVSPTNGAYQNGGGFGGFGDGNGWWVILLILLLAGGFNNGMGYGGGNGGGNLYPWMNQAEITSDGFRDQMLNSNVTSIRDGINAIQTQLCNGFAGVEQGASARAMANMQQMFNMQSQFADCCCENRLANCQTQNIIQNEGNMTRFADANNTRDLLTNQTANTQAILDKLCQLELDAKNDKINDLERQLTMANLNASQTAQNAFIAQGFADEVDQLYNRLSNCPVPSMPVYGRTPIFTCPSQNGCGCGNF